MIVYFAQVLRFTRFMVATHPVLGVIAIVCVLIGVVQLSTALARLLTRND